MYFTPEFLTNWHKKQARLRMEQMAERDAAAFADRVDRVQAAMDRQLSIERRRLIEIEFQIALAEVKQRFLTTRGLKNVG